MRVRYLCLIPLLMAPGTVFAEITVVQGGAAEAGTTLSPDIAKPSEAAQKPAAKPVRKPARKAVAKRARSTNKCPCPPTGPVEKFVEHIPNQGLPGGYYDIEMPGTARTVDPSMSSGYSPRRIRYSTSPTYSAPRTYPTPPAYSAPQTYSAPSLRDREQCTDCEEDE
jgi:hypothetical protein